MGMVERPRLPTTAAWEGAGPFVGGGSWHAVWPGPLTHLESGEGRSFRGPGVPLVPLG